jgi:hypothetical protein
MAAHKYWRVQFANSLGGVYIQLSEIAFIDASGADLSVGGSASASSYYGGGYESANAFDKNTGTDYCSAADSWPVWVQYEHPSAVEVAGVKIRCASNASWAPERASQLTLLYSDEGSNWAALADDDLQLTISSGSFAANALVTLLIAPIVPLQVLVLEDGLMGGAANWRAPESAMGTITNRVFAKASAEAPEQPMPGARVRLHRLADGYCAWQGLSDADGYYHAQGLEVGLRYYPVAIDLLGQFKCVAAGPVTAVEA